MLHKFGSHLRNQWMGALALFLVLGSGTAYAVTQIDKNSVKSKHIVDNQVRSIDVEDNGLTGVDVDESSLDSADFAAMGSEGWQAAQLRNGSLSETFPGQFSPQQYCYWTNFGGEHSQAAYFRDPAGVVHLKGLVKANNGTQGTACGDIENYGTPVVFDLPAGYRPSERWLVPTVSANKPGRLDVLPNGRVQIQSGFPAWGDALQWVSLDGVTFRCGPSGENGCP